MLLRVVLLVVPAVGSAACTGFMPPAGAPHYYILDGLLHAVIELLAGGRCLRVKWSPCIGLAATISPPQVLLVLHPWGLLHAVIKGCCRWCCWWCPAVGGAAWFAAVLLQVLLVLHP
jgi:hypothetical protein